MVFPARGRPQAGNGVAAGEHSLVDSSDLVRKRVHVRRVNRENRIKQMREADAMSLRHKPERASIAIEAPGPAHLDDLQPGLVVPVEELIFDLAGRVLKGELDRVRAIPLGLDNGHDAIGDHSPQRRSWRQRLWSGMASTSSAPLAAVVGATSRIGSRRFSGQSSRPADRRRGARLRGVRRR